MFILSYFLQGTQEWIQESKRKMQQHPMFACYNFQGKCCQLVTLSLHSLQTPDNPHFASNKWARKTQHLVTNSSQGCHYLVIRLDFFLRIIMQTIGGMKEINRNSSILFFPNGTSVVSQWYVYKFVYIRTR